MQRRLFEEGNSKVRFSFQNAQMKNGTPRAYAADVIDKRWGWGDEAAAQGFWDALGKAAKAESLTAAATGAASRIGPTYSFIRIPSCQKSGNRAAWSDTAAFVTARAA